MLDLGSLLGILSGIFILLLAVYQGGDLGTFWQPQGFMITFGGTMAAVLISYPLKRIMRLFGILKNAFVGHAQSASEVIGALVNMAQKARREGLLALEDEVEELPDPFMKRGILLVVDGSDPELVKSILETELAFVEDRHRGGQKIFQTAGTVSPAFGMIGTLVGLIQMLGHLDTPEAIGPGLAVALTTTLYGVLLANLIFIPIAGKLQSRSQEEILMKEVMIEGILSIQSGDNPRILEEKLEAFLPPRVRGQADAEAGVQEQEVLAQDD